MEPELVSRTACKTSAHLGYEGTVKIMAKHLGCFIQKWSFGTCTVHLQVMLPASQSKKNTASFIIYVIILQKKERGKTLRVCSSSLEINFFLLTGLKLVLIVV